MVPFTKLHPHATLPTTKTAGAIGFDLYSTQEITLPPQSSTCIPIGLSCAILQGLYMRIACRSSLAVRDVSVEGGVMDNNFLGELQVILRIHTASPITIPITDAIAQGIFKQANKPLTILSDSLPSPPSTHHGFGSTNKHLRNKGICKLGPNYFHVDASR